MSILNMVKNDTREVWQRGPVDGVPALLQPVAHALLQALEEVGRYMNDFPPDLLWKRPAGVASVGFHLMHIRGVIDRLFTYARGEALSAEQLTQLSAEKEVPAMVIQPSLLVDQIRRQVDHCILQLKNTPETSLKDVRELGRKKIPTTVLGLLFHAAEHTQRHVGQLLVTSRIVQS